VVRILCIPGISVSGSLSRRKATITPLLYQTKLLLLETTCLHLAYELSLHNVINIWLPHEKISLSIRLKNIWSISAKGYYYDVPSTHASWSYPEGSLTVKKNFRPRHTASASE
jgi:hypothetical protein